jgi:hypothetical protein
MILILKLIMKNTTVFPMSKTYKILLTAHQWIIMQCSIILVPSNRNRQTFLTRRIEMATQNWIKKITALLLLTSQLTMGLANAATQQSAESNFIAGVETLKGQSLSQADQENQLEQLASVYAQNSKAEGRADRFSQALVDFGIATPARAAVIADKAQNDPASLSNISLDGAQFSSCPLGLGIAGVIIGAVSYYLAITDNTPNDMDGFVALMMGLPIAGVVLAGTCAD